MYIILKCDNIVLSNKLIEKIIMKNLLIVSTLMLRNLCVIIAAGIVFITIFVGILLTNAEIKLMGSLSIQFGIAAIIFGSVNYFLTTLLEKLKYKYSCN